MRVKWGNKNESITFETTEKEGYQKNDEKRFLAVLEKQVCNRGIYEVAIKYRVADVERQLRKKDQEIQRLKDRTLWGRIKSVFFSPGGLIMKGI